MALYAKLVSEHHLPYGITQCYLPPHPTQVNMPCLNPIYLSWRDGRLSWHCCWFYSEMVYPASNHIPLS